MLVATARLGRGMGTPRRYTQHLCPAQVAGALSEPSEVLPGAGLEGKGLTEHPCGGAVTDTPWRVELGLGVNLDGVPHHREGPGSPVALGHKSECLDPRERETEGQARSPVLCGHRGQPLLADFLQGSPQRPAERLRGRSQLRARGLA